MSFANNHSFLRPHHRMEEKQKCILCGWKGRLSECKEEYENSIGPLSGREALNFNCPECGYTVEEIVWKMS